MRLMRLLGVALVWVLGVVTVASVSWVAINSAGRQVVEDAVVADSHDGGTSVADPVTPATTPSSPSTRPTASPTATPTPGRHGTTGTTPTGGSPGGSASTPAGTGSSSPASHPATSNPPPPPSSQGPTPVSATQTTSGGSMWLECTGTTVSNSLALPSEGWSAARGQHSPSDLEVWFRRSSLTIEVIGTCTGGQPRFTVRTSHGDE